MNEKRGTVSSKNNTLKCTSRSRRAQASMEYLMVAGIAFVIIVPMMYILYQYTSNLSSDVTDSKLGKIGTDIANTAEQIFYLGEPSRTTLRYDMPEGVYDIEVTGDRSIIFKLGDPSSPKEVVTFANVDIISYLVPDDFTKGRKNLKIEAEKDHVVLYTGDKETAILKYGAYSIFKELMKGVELVYGQKKLISGSRDSWTIDENKAGDFAYISSPLSKIDVSADVTVNSLTNSIYFFVGNVVLKQDGTGTLDSVSKTLGIEMGKSGVAGFFNFFYDNGLYSATLNPGSQTNFVVGGNYNLKITELAYSDCSMSTPVLCNVEPPLIPADNYYILIVSEGGNVKASAYVEKNTVDNLNLPMGNLVFGDVSSTEGITTSSITINPANLGPVISQEKKSSSTTERITTSIKITQLDITSNTMSFIIDNGVDPATGDPITIPMSFHSYYPLTSIIPLLQNYDEEESCFEFTLDPSGTVTITEIGLTCL